MLVALSIRQPWLELVLQGRKTVEVRSWATKYRGPLVLHASRKIDLEACSAYGYDPRELKTGGILGTADLTDCICFTPESWTSSASSHLNLGEFAPGLVGWTLQAPERLKFVAFWGRLGLFHVPSTLLTESVGAL